LGRSKVTDAQARQRRAEIMQAATEVFAKKGFLASGIADIAKKLDVGHGTIYRYFPNKLEIFLCILREAIDEMLQISERYNKMPTHSAAEYELQFKQEGVEYMMLFFKNPQRLRFVFEEMHADLKVRKLIDDAMQKFQKKSEQNFEKGIRVGAIRPDIHVPSVARLTNAMIFETMRSIILSSDLSTINTQIVESLQSLILRGVGNQVAKKR
jgi:AcrR family transcriptional regulator